MIASEQLVTVLVTAAVPTIAVLVGILVIDFRWSVIAWRLDAGRANTNRRFDTVVNMGRV